MWFSEARRLLKDGGNLLCFIDWRQLPTLTDAVQCADFMWRGVAVWDKLNSRPNKNGIAQEAEFRNLGDKRQHSRSLQPCLFARRVAAPYSKHHQQRPRHAKASGANARFA